MSETQKFNEKILAVFLAGNFLFASFVLGIFVAGVCLHDPDTCFHLALGKWIAAHGSLPMVDPFSANLNAYARVIPRSPLMQYEWLSELSMYLPIHFFGLAGLIILTAVILALSFLYLPTIWLASSGCPLFLAFVLSTTGAAASSFRFFARPEMFSYFSLALAIYLIEKLERRDQLDGRQRISPLQGLLLLILLFAFWANAHILFPVGLLYVTCHCLLSLADSYLSRKQMAKVDLAILLAAFLGTLLNPWGIGLWQYFLGLPNSPTTGIIIENAPFQIADIADPTYWPLCVLILLCFFIVAFRLRTNKLSRPILTIGLLLFSFALACFKHRLAPFAVLSMLSAVAESYTGSTKSRLNSQAFWFFSIIALAIAGSVLTITQIAPPTLPQAGKAFHPPFKAIAFLQKSLPPGHLFNDWQLGSMLEYYLPKPPDIFLDGRISSYDPNLVFDYRKMRNCEGNWQELMSKYKISWVFLIPDEPLALKLMSDPSWNHLYEDKDAVILQRKDTP